MRDWGGAVIKSQPGATVDPNAATSRRRWAHCRAVPIPPHPGGADALIVDHTRCVIATAWPDAVIAAGCGSSGPLTTWPYRRDFDLSRCTDDPSQFVRRFERNLGHGRMQRFRGSQDFRALLEHDRKPIGDIDEMRNRDRLRGPDGRSTALRTSPRRVSRSRAWVASCSILLDKAVAGQRPERCTLSAGTS